MSNEQDEDKYRDYREAIRRRVCAICLDGADDGSCGLGGAVTCAIDEHLPRVVDVVVDVGERRESAYAAAIEARVCSHCIHRDALGLCHLRRDGRCTIAVYLPLVVEAIQEVEARRRGGA